VKRYPPNGYGLYDTAGNVWEWCADWYRPLVYAERAGRVSVHPVVSSADHGTPPELAERVIRGGSYLCHVVYCESYRPAARRGNTPDTAQSHLGFRCARDAR
jgi:formylglycine-generating enzyme required for sulfatase activity